MDRVWPRSFFGRLPREHSGLTGRPRQVDVIISGSLVSYRVLELLVGMGAIQGSKQGHLLFGYGKKTSAFKGHKQSMEHGTTAGGILARRSS